MILADTLARVRMLESQNMSVEVSFCTKSKTSFDRSKIYSNLHQRETERDRDTESDRNSQKQSETGRDRQTETDTQTET